jgi:hypothetical protein
MFHAVQLPTQRTHASFMIIQRIQNTTSRHNASARHNAQLCLRDQRFLLPTTPYLLSQHMLSRKHLTSLLGRGAPLFPAPVTPVPLIIIPQSRRQAEA